jgi:hypothetical protein
MTLTENDFADTLEEWEDRVIAAASYFRLHRYYGRGGLDRMQAATFLVAKTAAKHALEGMPGCRVLIYAVTDSGRSVLIPKEKWDSLTLGK